MWLTRQQLRGTLADSTGVFTPQIPAVVQEELKQGQVVLPQLPPQEEVASEPAVEVLDQAAGTHHSIGELLYVGTHSVITPSERLSQDGLTRHRFGSHVGRDCTCK